jgi:hypothetical protein
MWIWLAKDSAQKDGHWLEKERESSIGSSGHLHDQ